MKTLKTLFRQLLYGEKEKEHEAPLEINNPINSPIKSYNDERETDEIPGNPNLDSPIPPETSSTVEELQSFRQSGDPGGESERKSGGEPGIEFDSQLREAFEKGVIEGRNQRIEELFFQNHDDGIPAFRGAVFPQSPGSDIFSLAREA